MANREPVQRRHEDFVLEKFLEWYREETGHDFSIVQRPDPPDAVVEDHGMFCWVEVTNAFYSDEWARDLCSHATDGEDDFSMGHGHVSMDRKTAIRFVNVVSKKLSKESYSNVFYEYGVGILVVIIQSPWFNDHTVDVMREEWEVGEFKKNTGYIGKIYIGWRANGGYDFCEWEM